jgi:hypothetical protein
MAMHIHQPQSQMFMPMDEPRSLWGCSSSGAVVCRHPRSASIAIVRTANSVAPTEDDVSVADQTYELATWQMYNRIVEHRRKHPPARRPAALESTLIATTFEDDSCFRPLRKDAGSSIQSSEYENRVKSTPLPIDSEMDGEIFDLEL